MATAKQLDPTIYPESDHMGEGELQQLINELLRPLLARFLASQGVVAHVGSNTFLYYVRHNSTARIAPDVYVLPGIEQTSIAARWKLFDLGVAPTFAFEVVSTNREKDYAEAPPIHGAIGTRELVIFDPAARGRKSRFVWQLHRRVRGAFRLVEQSQEDCIRSSALGCFLRVTGHGDTQRVRIATGPRGDELFPTEGEAERAEKERAVHAERAEKDRAVHAERAEKERAVAEAQAEKDRAVAEAQAERAEKDRARAEVEALRKELARRR